jgi:hypothetical protein
MCWNKLYEWRININVIYDSVRTNFDYKTPIPFLKLVSKSSFKINDEQKAPNIKMRGKGCDKVSPNN